MFQQVHRLTSSQQQQQSLGEVQASEEGGHSERGGAITSHQLGRGGEATRQNSSQMGATITANS